MKSLEAFAAHCDRVGVARRPTIFVQFVDIWGEPRGEIGLPDPDDVTHTCFALLSPWAMIPTIGEARLVVDELEYLRVTHLKANLRGFFEPSWKVPYRMADDGTLIFDEPIRDTPPKAIGVALQAVKKERDRQRYWEFGHSIDSVIPVVEALLDSGDSIVPWDS